MTVLIDQPIWPALVDQSRTSEPSELGRYLVSGAAGATAVVAPATLPASLEITTKLEGLASIGGPLGVCAGELLTGSDMVAFNRGLSRL
jgi:hypothetical protein